MNERTSQGGPDITDSINEPISFQDYKSGHVNLFDAPPGFSISSLPDLSAIDELVENANLWRRFEAENGVTIKGDLHFKSVPSNFIVRYLDKNRFYGKKIPVMVTKLPFDLEQFTDNIGSVIPDYGLTLLSQIALSSSGRGVIGILSVESSTAIAGNASYYYLTRRNRILKQESGVSVLDRLFQESMRTWETSQMEALRTAVNGGLPSLGKRR